MNTHKIFTPEQIKELADIIRSEKSATFVEKIKAAAAENPEAFGRFKMIITTEDIDRAGDIVSMDGWQLDNYKNNPIVLWAHSYHELPVGVTDNIYIEGGKMVAEGYFAPEEANPHAQHVRKLYELGFINTASVGFIPLEFASPTMASEGQKIVKQELLEWSFVPVPANPHALNLMKEAQVDTELMMTKGFLIKEEAPAEDKKPDEEVKAAAEGDTCTMADGTEGTMQAGEDGELVCTMKKEAPAAPEAKTLDQLTIKQVIEQVEAMTQQLNTIKGALEPLLVSEASSTKSQSNAKDWETKDGENELQKLIALATTVLQKGTAEYRKRHS